MPEIDLLCMSLFEVQKRIKHNSSPCTHPIGINPITTMKKHLLSVALNRSFLVVLVAALAIASCKSKKKVVETPEPASVEAPAPILEKSAPVVSADEVAVEKLENYFDRLSAAGNASMANQTIQEVLGMFSNQETPVLIVIHEENAIKDYDEPTTIKKYLEYLKDTKKNLNFISDIRMDSNGKVSELELRRK